VAIWRARVEVTIRRQVKHSLSSAAGRVFESDGAGRQFEFHQIPRRHYFLVPLVQVTISG
jgi:hypothetical protein